MINYTQYFQNLLAKLAFKYLSQDSDSLADVYYGAVYYYHASVTFGPNPYIKTIPAGLVNNNLLRAAELVDGDEFGTYTEAYSVFSADLMLRADVDHDVISGATWSEALKIYALNTSADGINTLLAYGEHYIDGAEVVDLNETLGTVVSGYAYGHYSEAETTDLVDNLLAVAAERLHGDIILEALQELISLGHADAILEVLDNVLPQHLSSTSSGEADNIAFRLVNANEREAITDAEFTSAVDKYLGAFGERVTDNGLREILVWSARDGNAEAFEAALDHVTEFILSGTSTLEANQVAFELVNANEREAITDAEFTSAVDKYLGAFGERVTDNGLREILVWSARDGNAEAFEAALDHVTEFILSGTSTLEANQVAFELVNANEREAITDAEFTSAVDKYLGAFGERVTDNGLREILVWSARDGNAEAFETALDHVTEFILSGTSTLEANQVAFELVNANEREAITDAEFTSAVDKYLGAFGERVTDNGIRELVSWSLRDDNSDAFDAVLNHLNDAELANIKNVFANQLGEADISIGSNGRDIIYEYNVEGSAEIHALDGNDVVYGGHGDTVLYGGEGSDILYDFYGGDDILHGGDGSDRLYGGVGFDTFVFKQGEEGVDTIYAFDKAEDAFDLSDYLTGFDPVQDAINDFVFVTQQGSRVIVSVDVDGTGDAAGAVDIASIYAGNVTSVDDLNLIDLDVVA